MPFKRLPRDPGDDLIRSHRNWLPEVAGGADASDNGNHTLQFLNCINSSVNIASVFRKLRHATPPTVFVACTRVICQIDRLPQEWCASIFLRDPLYSLIDINLLVLHIL